MVACFYSKTVWNLKIFGVSSVVGQYIVILCSSLFCSSYMKMSLLLLSPKVNFDFYVLCAQIFLFYFPSQQA